MKGVATHIGLEKNIRQDWFMKFNIVGTEIKRSIKNEKDLLLESIQSADTN